MKKLCLCVALLTCAPVFGAHAQLQQQRECSRLVAANIKATRQSSPAVYATIKDYTFEWSKAHNSCVMIIQYRVHQKDKLSETQIIAVNAATMQPMEGYKNVFLVPASDLSQTMDAVNFLVERYSH